MAFIDWLALNENMLSSMKPECLLLLLIFIKCSIRSIENNNKQQCNLIVNISSIYSTSAPSAAIHLRNYRFQNQNRYGYAVQIEIIETLTQQASPTSWWERLMLSRASPTILWLISTISTASERSSFSRPLTGGWQLGLHVEEKCEINFIETLSE